MIITLQLMDEDAQFDKEPFEHEDPNPHVNLEDLCRSHLVRLRLTSSI